MTTKLGLSEYERKVWSQNGEDGILEWLAPKAKTKRVVEIGYDPVECNSRNLVLNHGWTAWLFDAKHGEFITAENVNDFVEGEIGVFSLDIDGNEYWVWKALKAEPDIVCIEYNAHLGESDQWVLRYDPKHRWDHTDTHGASIAALCKLGAEKGYQCVGCDSKGVNAFFIRRELGEGLPDLTPEQAYVPPARAPKRGVDFRRMICLPSMSDPSPER